MKYRTSRIVMRRLDALNCITLRYLWVGIKKNNYVVSVMLSDKGEVT